VWLAQLGDTGGLDVGYRLRLSKPILETLEKMLTLVSTIQEWKDLPPSLFTRKLEKIPVYGIFALYCISDDEILKQKLEEYATNWRFVAPVVNGNDLRERGIPPGPHYASILDEIRSAWLDGKVSSAADEKTLLESLVEEFNDRKDH